MNNINLPSFVDNTCYKYINLDEKFVISLAISEYPKYTEFLQIMESIPKNINYDLSMYIKKQDTGKILKDLTYKISSSMAEIKTSNKNQIDIDIINNLKEDAINLRKEIQINNQDIFNVSVIITFYSYDYKDLMHNIKLFQSILYSKGLISNLTNFRHLDSYLLSLPLNNSSKKVQSLNERSFTTDSLSLNFPFYTKNAFDKNGIIFGITGSENKLCNINIFDEKYLNSNMCILGSSGAGKSYFTKLLIIRNFFSNKRQFVFDYEGEYEVLALYLNKIYLLFNEKDCYYYNIFQVNKYELKDSNWFSYKVKKILYLITKLIDIKTDKEKDIIKDAIISTYKEFGIDENVESVYKTSSTNLIFVDNTIKNSELFPTLNDLVKNIKNKKIASLITDNIIKKYQVISNHSNFNITDDLIFFNTKEILNTKDSIVIEYLLYEIKELAAFDLKNTIIYIDEIWKYIDKDKNKGLSNVIFENFKTLRKYNCSIIGITQDIGDFFSVNNGEYGKSMLNNCGFKLFFRLEYSDKKLLENLSLIDEDEITKISRLEKGQVLMNFCNNRIVLNIKSSEYEEKIMEEKKDDSFSFK